MDEWLASNFEFHESHKKKEKNLKRDDSKFERSTNGWKDEGPIMLFHSATLALFHVRTIQRWGPLSPLSHFVVGPTRDIFPFSFLFFSLVYRLAKFSIPRASEMGTHALSVVLHFRLFTCHALWKSVMRRWRDESWQRPQHGIGGRIFIIAIKKIIVENQELGNRVSKIH